MQNDVFESLWGLKGRLSTNFDSIFLWRSFVYASPADRIRTASKLLKNKSNDIKILSTGNKFSIFYTIALLTDIYIGGYCYSQTSLI